MKLPGTIGLDQTFVIGDIHGRSSALKRAFEHIRTTRRRSDTRKLVFLGDIIDRGPGSIESLNLARSAKEIADVDEVICLYGNHELMMLQALKEPELDFSLWLQNGGQAVLNELGVPMSTPLYMASMLKDKLHAELEFIETFKTHHISEDVLMVHAGIDPLKSIYDNFKDSWDDTWAWIRSEFLYHEGHWDTPERVVIHGHTPSNFGKKLHFVDFENVDLVQTHRRINLDIGANQWDQLLVLEVNDQDYSFSLIPDESYDPFIEDSLGLFR